MSEVQSQGVANQLMPGTYKTIGGTAITDIITMLVNGDTDTVKMTIPEGWTIKVIAKRVEKVTKLPAKDFRNACKHAEVYQEEFPFLEAAYKGTLEGFLFPDTYDVPKDATVDDVIRLMLTRYKAVMEDIDMTYADKKNLTPYDVTILASIVEKESASEKDMKEISAVFYNRLHENMSLGSDVTTYYAVGKDFSVDPKDYAFVITYSIKNEGSEPRRVAPWEITRVPNNNGLIFFNAVDSIWPAGLMTFETAHNAAWYKTDEAPQNRKVNADGRGWLAYCADGLLLVKKFQDLKADEPAPGEAEIQVYVNRGKSYIELESQGAYTLLQPGEELKWTVRWYLKPVDKTAEPSKSLMETVQKLVK